jgi:hypothetical protein
MKKGDRVYYKYGEHGFTATVRSLKPERNGMVCVCRDDNGLFCWAHTDRLTMLEEK